MGDSSLYTKKGNGKPSKIETALRDALGAHVRVFSFPGGGGEGRVEGGATEEQGYSMHSWCLLVFCRQVKSLTLKVGVLSGRHQFSFSCCFKPVYKVINGHPESRKHLLLGTVGAKRRRQKPALTAGWWRIPELRRSPPGPDRNLEPTSAFSGEESR